MRNLHLAQILFNRPLMITEAKLNTILYVLGPRLNLDPEAMHVPRLRGDELNMPPGRTLPIDMHVPGARWDELLRAEAAQISDQERRRAGYSVSGGVGIIGVYGPLMHRLIASDYPSGGPTTYGEIRQAFDLAEADDSVLSIAMIYDTPGGEVNGVFDLADHIYQSRGKKPITAVINESALSAGYLLASAADRIIIPRTGGAGSIGVVATHSDFSRAEEAAGIRITHVFAGARKADFSPHAPLSDEAYTVLQTSVNEAYGLFVKTVARNRNMTEKAVRDTEAATYEGKRAVAAGLADEVAPADQAIKNSLGRRKTLTPQQKALAAPNSLPIEGRVLQQNNEEVEKMNIEELKSNHPDLVEKIEHDARTGMITEAAAAEATSIAIAAEQARVCGLVAAAFGEESGKKLSAVAAKGLSADDITALGIRFGDGSTAAGVDLESRAAILAGLKAAAPEPLRGVQTGGDAAERAAAVSAIAAGGSKKR